MTPPISEFTGQPVTDTTSEEWRHECECRYVLDCMPDKITRQRYLYGEMDLGATVKRRGIAQIRGKAEADRIRDGVLKLYRLRKEQAEAARVQPDMFA